MEYYTLGKRNVHWANSVWHVAARAHFSSLLLLLRAHCLPSTTGGNILQTPSSFLTGVSAAPNMDIYLFPHLNEA